MSVVIDAQARTAGSGDNGDLVAWRGASVQEGEACRNAKQFDEISDGLHDRTPACWNEKEAIARQMLSDRSSAHPSISGLSRSALLHISQARDCCQPAFDKKTAGASLPRPFS
jgi:predicted membrane-bound mannosyltransferase